MKQKTYRGPITQSRLFQFYRHALLVVMILRELILIAADSFNGRRKAHAAA